MIKLWMHECMRVFHDRLISQGDRSEFITMLQETLTAKFKRKIGKGELEYQNPLIFGSFIPTVPQIDDPSKTYKNIYCEIEDREGFTKACNDALDNFNMLNRAKRMDLVLFDDAIDHIVKIHRVITTEGGNMMLVGVGGSGRKSLTALAISIATYETFEIEMKKGYSIKDWRDDLREKLFQSSGVESIPHVFLFSDT